MNKKIKLAFIVSSIENCGPVNVVLNIILNLDLNKFDIMLISIKKLSSDYYKNFEQYCILGIVILENKNYLEKLCKNLDIIHSHGYYPDKYVSQLQNNKIKKFTTVHCMLFKDYIQEYGILKGFIGALSHIQILKTKQFNQIVACSKSVYQYLYQYKLNNLTSINNGVDQRKYHLITAEEKERRKFELNLQGQIVFIYAGRLIKRKQVPELIKTFNLFCLNNNNCVLLVLGDGKDKSKCLDLAKQNTYFLGKVHNPEYYYQLSDYVLSMSNAEGYPMSILEAVSCGCYAYLSDIPSHKEFIQQNLSYADYITNISIQVNHNNYNAEQLSAKVMAKKYEQLYLERLQ